MMLLRVALVIVWALAFAAGRTTWSSGEPSANAATSAEFTDPSGKVSGAVAGWSLMEPDDRLSSSPPNYDLFGNEIEEAIADYRIDRGGDLYERHSPETEVERLGSPVI